MDSSDKTSLARIVAGLQESDPDAQREFFERFWPRAVGLAQKRMADLPKSISDENDIAQSALKSVCQALAQGKFVPEHDDRIWTLVAKITVRKVCKYNRWLSRHAGEQSMDELLAVLQDPSEELFEKAVDINLDLYAKLSQVDPRYVRIVHAEREGYTSREIADQLNCDERTVKRHLRMIRLLLQQE